ncbi:Hypothetical protein I595_2880 [Croceitalea dokdonensis DOKDO 023]|uniref:Uncharacterized protein n=1 Tax=Croceitalea dokdonensis DOKDO 023 TaxID=1300341 RepID=A0A0P7ASI2_9FLAO|nr:Hypothetical protein I595_2880 [Croceitalea dokdonensis DOKDO 023]
MVDFLGNYIFYSISATLTAQDYRNLWANPRAPEASLC